MWAFAGYCPSLASLLAEVGYPSQLADAAPPADASSADVAADVAHPCTISCPTKCPGELSFALPPKNTSLIDIGNSKPNIRHGLS